jgi:hypothetical protein
MPMMTVLKLVGCVMIYTEGIFLRDDWSLKVGEQERLRFAWPENGLVWFVYLYLGSCALWVQEQVTRKGLMIAMEIRGSWDPGIGSGLWSGSVGKYFLKDEEK